MIFWKEKRGCESKPQMCCMQVATYSGACLRVPAKLTDFCNARCAVRSAAPCELPYNRYVLAWVYKRRQRIVRCAWQWRWRRGRPFAARQRNLGQITKTSACSRGVAIARARAAAFYVRSIGCAVVTAAPTLESVFSTRPVVALGCTRFCTFG